MSDKVGTNPVACDLNRQQLWLCEGILATYAQAIEERAQLTACRSMR